jgi:plastocyanin
MWDMMDGGMMDGHMRGMMGGGGPETTGSATGEGEVRIVDFSFQPTTMIVTPGTTLTWTNEDSAPHTATGSDFDTGRLDQGDSGEITFESAGEYDYICTYHPDMKGSVVVR